MRTHLHRLVLPALALVASCSRAPEPTSQTTPTGSFPPPTPDTRLKLTPADLLTDVSFTPIRVNLPVNLLKPAELDALAKTGVHLRTYPELVDVPFTTVVFPGSTGSVGNGNGPVPKDASSPTWDPPQDAYIELNPKSPLTGSSWYVVSADNLPASLAKPSRAILKGEPNAYAARFATGSFPILKAVAVGEDGRVLLGFSEGVVVDEGTIGANLQVLDDALKPCVYVPRGIPNGPPVFSTTGVGYKCSPSAFKGQRVRVDAKVALKTQGGATLQALDATSTTTQGLLRPLGVIDVTLSYESKSWVSWSP